MSNVTPTLAQEMTNDDRLVELRRQRNLLRDPEFRTSVQARRDILSVIVPLLNFNNVYYSNAVRIADVLGRPGFSSNYYDHAFAQMDSIVSQAINELECGLSPAPAEETPEGLPFPKELRHALEERYIMLTKTKFIAFLGGLIGFLGLVGVISWQVTFKTLETVEGKAALGMIKQRAAEAEGIVKRLNEIKIKAESDAAQRTKLIDNRIALHERKNSLQSERKHIAQDVTNLRKSAFQTDQIREQTQKKLDDIDAELAKLSGEGIQ